MSDLAAMAAQKRNSQQNNQTEQNTSCSTYNNTSNAPEDPPDLKTPTAENQQNFAEQKVFNAYSCGAIRNY